MDEVRKHIRSYLALIVSALLLSNTVSIVQLTPPGLSGAKAVGWVAVGFTQKLSPNWSTAAYVGTSGQSTLSGYGFLRKRAISIVENEWTHTFSPHWHASLAASLRLQSVYEKKPPYEPEDPAVRTEIRTYSRLMYRHKQGERLNWTHTFRPEYRQFFTPDWHKWPSSPLQIRLRAAQK